MQIRLSRMLNYLIDQQAKAKLYLIRHDSNDKKILYYPYPYPYRYRYPYPYPYPYPAYSFGVKN